MLDLENELQKYFGFSAFREGQKEVIQSILNRESALAVFSTGAGKSLCYQLPALLLPHLTLVVSPLLSLMKNQLDFLRSKNIPAASLDSSLSLQEYQKVIKDAINGDIKIIMVSVERFRNERFRESLNRMKISLLVIDEAHCISEWGHNFRPEYLNLPSYKKEFNIPESLLLTATAQPKVVEDMCKKFEISKENAYLTDFYRSNLNFHITPCDVKDRDALITKRILENPEISTIVYVTLQKTAEEVASFLKNAGIVAEAYHAGMGSELRANIQQGFMEDKIHCIVATIAFGMGIDKPNVYRVFHYNLPHTVEGYSQEVGRAGRDGNQSHCEVFANLDDMSTLENFIYGDTPERDSIEFVLNQIQKSPNPAWNISPLTLANESDIRLLPLKTLLVYLQLEGILLPQGTTFDKYAIQFKMRPQDVLNNFQGEKRQFLEDVFRYLDHKTTWSYLNMTTLLESLKITRQRVITALQYFEEKDWIVLKTTGTLDRYKLLNQNFNLKQLTDKLFTQFISKEREGVERIRSMVHRFETAPCLSQNLSEYFGQTLDSPCGHCSSCLKGAKPIPNSLKEKQLSSFNYSTLTQDLLVASKEELSPAKIAHFLCGITSPQLTKLKAKKLQNFGVLENFPYLKVKQWIEER